MSYSIYKSGQQTSWLKTKSFAEAEFHVAGVLRLPGEAPLGFLKAESGEYVGSAFVAPPSAERERFWAYAEAGGGEPPAGAARKAKAVWSRPGRVGTVKFLRGDDHLRHASLKAVLTAKGATNRQLRQREAVGELLARLRTIVWCGSLVGSLDMCGAARRDGHLVGVGLRSDHVRRSSLGMRIIRGSPRSRPSSPTIIAYNLPVISGAPSMPRNRSLPTDIAFRF